MIKQTTFLLVLNFSTSVNTIVDMKLLKDTRSKMTQHQIDDTSAFFLNNEIVVVQVYFPPNEEADVCVLAMFPENVTGNRFGFYNIKNPEDMNSCDSSVKNVLSKNNDVHGQVVLWSFDSLHQLFNNIDVICRNGPP